MGIKIRVPELYEASLRKLFPQGAYWDRQFQDPASDCSLFCKAKLDEFIRYRTRMSGLFDESIVDTAGETLDDWERVITGTVRRDLEPEERRALLFSRKNQNTNPAAIREIGRIYGIDVGKIEFPFRPAFFGFSRFAIGRIASPASFSTIFIYASAAGNGEAKAAFEKTLRSEALANYILYFFYGAVPEGDF
ncbi:MAG: YmfQ family protein [Treponema sp.]|jgi:hypothetical protein|nr:YmfQ family protein [Treponema sp.]